MPLDSLLNWLNANRLYCSQNNTQGTLSHLHITQSMAHLCPTPTLLEEEGTECIHAHPPPDVCCCPAISSRCAEIQATFENTQMWNQGIIVLI